MGAEHRHVDADLADHGTHSVGAPAGDLTQPLHCGGDTGRHYLDDGRVASQKLDGNMIAVPSYDANGQLTGVSYPTGTGNAGNGGSLSSITRDPQGHETGIGWALPGSHTLADSVTLSQAARVTTEASTVDGVGNTGWSYGYAAAGRLTSATGAHPISIGTQTLTYDSADRVTGIIASAGGGTQTVTYTLDASDRMTTRLASGTGTGAENDTTSYGYSGSGDTADLQLGTGNTLAERYLSLPGGTLLTRRYTTTGGDVWSIPKIHGDITATTGPTGLVTGTGFLTDPYGQPIDPATGVTNTAATPTTRTNGPTDAWEDQHQRGYENHAGLNATLMGARLYLPALGQFASVDPVPGGARGDWSGNRWIPYRYGNSSGSPHWGYTYAQKHGVAYDDITNALNHGYISMARSGGNTFTYFDVIATGLQHITAGAGRPIQ